MYECQIENTESNRQHKHYSKKKKLLKLLRIDNVLFVILHFDYEKWCVCSINIVYGAQHQNTTNIIFHITPCVPLPICTQS